MPESVPEPCSVPVSSRHYGEQYVAPPRRYPQVRVTSRKVVGKGDQHCRMTSIPPIAREAEDLVRQLVGELERPRLSECICCYVIRLLDVSPCDGTLRHAIRYRNSTAPRATAMARRLMQVGAGCDCEIFWNGFQPRIVTDYADGDDVEI